MTKDLNVAKPLPSDFSDRVFTLNLILSAPEKISVRSCEVIGRQFRNRTSFSHTNEISDVLNEKLSNAVRVCMAKVPEGAHVLSLPEFVVELPGLALSGVHIMIMEVRNGMRSAIFRFKEFIGSVNHAFKIDVGIEEPYSSYSERLAINVLSDICLPILNIAREVEFAHVNEGTPVPKSLEDRLREFEFQTELLKRFIHNTSVRPDEAPLLFDNRENGAPKRLMAFGSTAFTQR